jgi:hypothetical protein
MATRSNGLRLVAAAISMIACQSLGAHATARSGSQCLPADARSASLMQYVAGLINDRDRDSRILRDSVGLRDVPASSLVLVTDPAICARAAGVFDSLASVKKSGRLLWVVRAGKARYAVQDPKATAGEWATVMILDSEFRLVRVLLM